MRMFGGKLHHKGLSVPVGNPCLGLDIGMLYQLRMVGVLDYVDAGSKPLFNIAFDEPEAGDKVRLIGMDLKCPGFQGLLRVQQGRQFSVLYPHCFCG